MSHFWRNVTIDISRRKMIVIFFYIMQPFGTLCENITIIFQLKCQLSHSANNVTINCHISLREMLQSIVTLFTECDNRHFSPESNCHIFPHNLPIFGFLAKCDMSSSSRNVNQENCKLCKNMTILFRLSCQLSHSAKNVTFNCDIQFFTECDN